MAVVSAFHDSASPPLAAAEALPEDHADDATLSSEDDDKEE